MLKQKAHEIPKRLCMTTGGGNVRDWSVQGRLEGCIGALLFSLLPPLLYAVTNLGLPSDMHHVWSLLLLTSAPLLMLTTLQVSLHTTSFMHFLICLMSCTCNQHIGWVIPSQLRLSLVCQLSQRLQTTELALCQFTCPFQLQNGQSVSHLGSMLGGLLQTVVLHCRVVYGG